MTDKLNAFDSHHVMTDVDRQSTKTIRTLFIGGIPLKSTPTDIEEYLTKFDDVESVVLPPDKRTGLLKGYAKAVLQSVAGVERIISHGEHSIGGLVIGVSRWTSTDEYLVRKKDISSRKVYVKFKARIGVEAILKYFEKYGNVEQFDVKRNPLNGRFRDFGYITYQHAKSANAAIKDHIHIVNGEKVKCELSKPTTKDDPEGPHADFRESHNEIDFFRKDVPFNKNRIDEKAESSFLKHEEPYYSLAEDLWRQIEQKKNSIQTQMSSKAPILPPRLGEKNPNYLLDSTSSPYSPTNEYGEVKVNQTSEHSNKSQCRSDRQSSQIKKEPPMMPPTKRQYFNYWHHKVIKNHDLPGNLQFKVKLPSAIRSTRTRVTGR